MLNFSFLQCASCFLSFSSSFSSSVQWVLNFLFSLFRFYNQPVLLFLILYTLLSKSRRIVPQGPIHKNKQKAGEIICKYKLYNLFLLEASSIFDGQGHLYTFIGLFSCRWMGHIFSLDDSFDEAHLQRAH